MSDFMATRLRNMEMNPCNEAADLIESQQQRIAQLEQERDAALADANKGRELANELLTLDKTNDATLLVEWANQRYPDKS